MERSARPAFRLRHVFATLSVSNRVSPGSLSPRSRNVPEEGGQRWAIASRTAGTTSCAHRFSVVSLRLSPGGSK